MWVRDTRSEYIDLAPFLAREPKPDPIEAIEVPLPSDSYLNNNNHIIKKLHARQERETTGNHLT